MLRVRWCGAIGDTGNPPEASVTGKGLDQDQTVHYKKEQRNPSKNWDPVVLTKNWRLDEGKHGHWRKTLKKMPQKELPLEQS
jgi:hypothetical protein